MNDNTLLTCTDKIPVHRFAQFNEILIACGGRYVSRPSDCGDSVRVAYQFFDSVGLGYAEFCERWNRVQLRVVEKRSGLLKRILAWIKGRLK